VQQYFAPRDLTTAEHISNRCGQRTVMVKSSSTREITCKEASGGFKGLSHSTYGPVRKSRTTSRLALPLGVA
jgi:type IV secretory pathway TraG/TraD family ATPase VirD4